MMRNPFKVHEFQRVMAGSRLGPGDAILDLGCGKGFQTQVLARSCRSAVGIDVSETQIEQARFFLKHSYVEKRVTFIAGRLEAAGLASESFDRVFSFCVLEHIPNLDQVLGELARVLKPGGEIHASVDALSSIKDASLIARHKSDHHVVQYFTPSSLRRQLEAAGFEVFEISPIMTSEFARTKFEDRIRRADFSYGLLDRLRFNRRLRTEEESGSGDEAGSAVRGGIMIVARARRPKP
jgi:ubiquinone/menaquinone biosynthesis C-methylase UbiE